MAPKNAKIWNEDLVTALRAREDLARQQGKQRQTTWREGAAIIESVREDIYQFKTGRIVNLPNKLSKTVDNEIRQIMAGNKPVLPEGYVPSNRNERTLAGGMAGNPFDSHPYVKKIKIRGGAFAILMAFHVCQGQRQSMTKQQIIQAAQPFCDEAMEENYHAGRLYGAWKGNETLARHNLILVQQARRAYNERAGGIRAMGKNSYSLTREGEQFIEALLKRHPEVEQQLAAHGHPGRTTSTTRSGFGHNFAAGSGMTEVGSSRLSSNPGLAANVETDKERLMNWVMTAEAGSAIDFDVGKDRRKQLHDFSDEISAQLRSRGLRLDHMSSGEGRGRALRIRLVQSGPAAMSSPGYVRDPHAQPRGLVSPESPKFDHSGDPFLVTSGDLPLSHSGLGARTLEESPLKRARTGLSAQEAAANAALYRQALHESANVSCEPKKEATVVPVDDFASPAPARARPKTKEPEIIELLDDTPTKPAARPASAIKKSPSPQEEDSKPAATAKRKLDFDAGVLEVLESDDEDDDLLLGRPVFDLKNNPSSVEYDLPGLPNGVSGLIIAIDNRERNRNCTPRQLRTDLTSLVATGPLAMAWPSSIPKAEICEKLLTHGDFNFMVKKQNGSESSTLPVMVERKRIGDLVQRSAKRDHWEQLRRMRGQSALSILLLEGDFRTAAAYQAFGAPEDWRVSDHTIEDEPSLLRFIGRAILSSDQIRFVQSKDEQDSLRSVAALGLVAIASEKSSFEDQRDNPYSAGKGNTLLLDRLQAGGIPWQIAKDVSREIGSASQLDKIYAAVSDEDCRKEMLAPLIEDACKQVGTSSASAWSKAIHSVYYTTFSDANKARYQYEEYESFVTNKAALLDQIHCGVSPDKAVNDSFSSGKEEAEQSSGRRKVCIELPLHMREVFGDSAAPGSFVSTKVGTKKNLVVMHTENDQHESHPLNIFLLEGSKLVEMLKKAMESRSTCYGASRSLAAQINSDCSFCEAASASPHGRRVLVIRGLGPALERYAKQPGYRHETRAVADMVLAHLMVNHNLTVLKAVRLGDSGRKAGVEDDLSKILKALALACFHFQLLMKKKQCHTA